MWVEDTMAEVREVDVVERHRGMGIMGALVIFILGALAIAVVVMMLLDVHWTISWPAGHVELGLKPPVATAATTPVHNAY
jgi:hypothetical protein